MRINQYLARCGVGSRRSVEADILEGLVQVNGEIITSLGYKVGPGDKVVFKGKVLKLPQESTVVAFHKPPKCLCSNFDPQGRTTIYHYLPPEWRNLHYVGRLDYASRGILLLTDDGNLSRDLTLPKNQVERLYEAKLSRSLKPHEIGQIKNGVEIFPGFLAKPKYLRHKDNYLQICLTEGKNREIRRILEFFDVEVMDLLRLEYAGVQVHGIAEGKIRKLKELEINEMKSKINPISK